LRGPDPELRKRLPVEVRIRLCDRLLVVGAEDAAPPVAEPEAPEILGDPLARPARHDPHPQAAPTCLPQVTLDSRPHRLGFQKLRLAHEPPGLDLLAVDRSTDKLFELGERVEAADRAHAGYPTLEGQLLAVGTVHLLPRPKRRPLAVDNGAVEVEEESPDHCAPRPPEAASTPGSAAITSEATRPRGGSCEAARAQAVAPAAAAIRASTPLATNAAMTPVSTSPDPAVASEGGPSPHTSGPSSGEATIVSGPFSRTTQRNRSTARRIAWSLCVEIHADSTSSSRASSPEWGVRTVAACRAKGSRPKRASASTTTGRSTFSSRRLTSFRVSASRPRPGPTASADARSAASKTSA